MDDEKILQLFWDRDRAAIPAAAEKYGSYCRTVAMNILEDREDAEECLNDTWLQAWNSIPPHRPAALAAFLGKITRNLALNRSKRRSAAKRGGGQLPLVLEELTGVLSGGDGVEEALEHKELAAAINGFLAGLPPRKRDIFVCRYWYFDSIEQIAARFGMGKNQVSVTLHRLRAALRDHLTERGFEL